MKYEICILTSNFAQNFLDKYTYSIANLDEGKTLRMQYNLFILILNII